MTSVGLASPLSYRQLQLNSAIRRFFFLIEKAQTAKHSQMTLSFRSPGTWKTLFHKAGVRANPTAGSTELCGLGNSCMLRFLCQRRAIIFTKVCNRQELAAKRSPAWPKLAHPSIRTSSKFPSLEQGTPI